MDSINSTTITGEYSFGSGCIANVEFNSIQEVDFDGSIRLIHKIGDLFYFVKDDIVLTVSTPMGQIWKICRDKVHSVFVSSEYIAVLYENPSLEVFHIQIEDISVPILWDESSLDEFLSFYKRLSC